VIQIKRAEFNHGGTRQWAAEHLIDCAILVFITQDAILANRDALAEIVECFSDDSVALAYGRQLPHKGATAIESHARLFNYRGESRKKDRTTVGELGPKVFFCSNSFAAYRRTTLLDLGGFKRELILGEDMEFAARAISAGFANQYCATATAFHSHAYTASQTFSRYFDIGVFDDTNSWMRDKFGSHRGEGAKFVGSEFHYLLQNDPAAMPLALCQTIAKLAGYRLGRLHRSIPLRLKRRLSMVSSYWERHV